MDFGFLLENVIHNELRIRGYDVQVGKMDNLEIDFVATRTRSDLTRERLFIQVSASIMDNATRQRELEPLRRLANTSGTENTSGRRMVLTLDSFGLGTTIENIEIVNAIDWLLA